MQATTCRLHPQPPKPPERTSALSSVKPSAVKSQGGGSQPRRGTALDTDSYLDKLKIIEHAAAELIGR